MVTVFGEVMSKEKRRDCRVFFDMPAELRVDDDSYPVGQIANLSLGGCLLSIKDDLPLGAECRLIIDNAPQGLKIEIDGIVIRNDAETIGVQFTQIEPDNLAHLRNIIKYTLPFLKYQPSGLIRSS
jgi:hypothetical protein